MRNGVAVVGDKDSVLAFKSIGLEVFPVSDENEARERVRLLARSYAVIFITDTLAQKIDSLLVRYKARPYLSLCQFRRRRAVTALVWQA